MVSFLEFDDRFEYYVHGTNCGDIESFFNKGLTSKYGNSLSSTLTPFGADEIKNRGLRGVLEWYANFYGFKYCFLIKIPKYYMGWMIHRDGSIEPPIPVWIPSNQPKTPYSNLKVLTPHLIAGVYSAERGKVMPNPNYNPKFDPTAMQYATEQIENMLLSSNDLYYQWMWFARARDEFGYDDLKRKDEAKNVWKDPLNRYNNIITEQYFPRRANVKK